MTKLEEYKIAKRNLLKLYIVANLLIIIGGILLKQDRIKVNLSLIGLVSLIVGCFCLLTAIIKRFSKRYRILRLEDDENSSLKEMAEEDGLTMLIGSMIIALCMLTAGIVFLWYLASFNWFKTVLFFIAFQLITDLRDFYNFDTKKDM